MRGCTPATAIGHLPRVALVPFLAVLVIGAAARPRIIDAAKHADRALLLSMVERKDDVNVTDADGTTALHWASYNDDRESADLLIRAGARVNAANDLGATPLWLASQNGSADMVRRLLQAGAFPNVALSAGETPLMVASRGGYPDVVDLLAAKGADVNARAGRGQTALMWAVAQKHPAVARRLIAHGADVHARSNSWTQVMAVSPHGLPEYNRAIPHGADTALLFAARVGDVESAAVLLGAGANANDADAWGVSALVLAAHSGFLDLVALLLDKGADPEADATGFNALHIAIMRRDNAMARALLARGANPNARLRTWTPTRRASRDWYFAPELVGATPFWLAARFAQPEMMRLLAQHGADPTVVHTPSYHVFDTAVPRSETLTSLMAAVGAGGDGSARAWVRATSPEPEPQVLQAAALAIELGADVNAVNTDGRTALDGAEALKYQSVVNLLVQKGARPRPPAFR